jgi:hypothetical protein
VNKIGRIIEPNHGRGMQHVWRIGECIHCFDGKPEGRVNLEDPEVGNRIILRSIFRKWDVRAWTGLVWFRTGTDGGNL